MRQRAREREREREKERERERESVCVCVCARAHGWLPACASPSSDAISLRTHLSSAPTIMKVNAQDSVPIIFLVYDPGHL